MEPASPRARDATAGSDRPRRRHGPFGWSLRTRLLVLLAALLAAMSVVIVAVTAIALRGVLLDQLDERLDDASARWRQPVPELFGPSLGRGYYNPSASDQSASDPTSELSTPVGTGASSPAGFNGGAALARFFGGPGQSPGTLGAVVAVDTKAADGPVVAGVEGGLIDDGEVRELSELEAAAVADLPADERPYTRRIDDSGEYRLVARVDPARQAVLVTGLPMDEVDATLTRMTTIGAIVGALGVGAAGVAGAAIVRVTLRPLQRVATTASRVAELPLDRGEVELPAGVPEADTDPRTEVGQVGAALNRMLGHIGSAFAARHASETRMRRFLADASHELRTPLAAISGYAELTRRMRDAVPPDVAHAMSRVEAESARMTELVSDLLLLARLDSGRPLEREPVDLSRLVVDATSDAHVAAPKHRFELDLPTEPVTVTGDAARLHQVLANLLANARTHTPAGTRVTTRLTIGADDGASGGGAAGPKGPPNGLDGLDGPDGPDGPDIQAGSRAQAGPGVSHVVLSVVDSGPGIPPRLLPQIFERFARGDGSRSRAAGSTGLGLSIVAAVVEAHGGRVAATSRPGRTEFTVCLPLPDDEPKLASQATHRQRTRPGQVPVGL